MNFYIAMPIESDLFIDLLRSIFANNLQYIDCKNIMFSDDSECMGIDISSDIAESLTYMITVTLPVEYGNTYKPIKVNLRKVYKGFRLYLMNNKYSDFTDGLDIAQCNELFNYIVYGK